MKATKTTIRYEVRYVGAPYGLGEAGETISRHRTLEAAEAAREKLQVNPRYYGLNTKVVTIVDGEI